jgi:hypothetical protein
MSSQYDIITKIYRPKKSYQSNSNQNKIINLKDQYELLDACSIGWLHCNKNDNNEIINNNSNTNCFHGKLITNPCIISSEYNPNMMIEIREEIFIWENSIWINDRVFTIDGKLLHGNKFNIPYKYKRIE